MTPDPIAEQLAGVYRLVLPETLLVLAGCAIYLGATFRPGRQLWGTVSLLVLAAAGWLLWHTPVAPAAPDAVRPLVLDSLALFIKAVALVGGAVLVLTSWDEVADERAAEYQASLLMIVAGVCLTAAANDLIMIFLALELISIPTYVILYLHRADTGARESAVKYFLLSVVSTGILLFGFSYLYGLAGTTNLTALLNALRGTDASGLPLLALVALVMVAAGLGFKITAVPFHFYAPDVYQGTALSTAALLAFVPKVAGFVTFFRVMGFVWPPDGRPGLALGTQAPILFWILATMTMSVGNILALLQNNVKRILAYSSVAHAGYMLIGLAVAPDLVNQPVVGGVASILFYLVAYGAMTIGVFAVLVYLSTPEHPVDTVDDLAGLSQHRPGMAFLMSVFLFSLIGMPATAGFVGKLFLFFGAMSLPEGTTLEAAAHARLFRWLALIGAINAAVGAWYYLRIVGVMYLRSPLRAPERPRVSGALVAVWACAALTLGLGLYPQPLVDAVQKAAGGR